MNIFLYVFSAFTQLSQAATSCAPIVGDRIRGSDLIAAGGRFKDMDPGLDLGPAPIPGLTRTFHAGTRLAGLCVERRTTPLSVGILEAAMRKALGDREARLEILDFCRVSVPQGEIEFLLSTLIFPLGQIDAPILWRGRALYDPGRSIPIWARVRLSVKTQRVVAVHEIEPGHLLVAEDVRPDVDWRFPNEHSQLQVADIVGMSVLRKISAGANVARSQLVAPRIVQSGETIEVRVLGSGSLITTNAVAERGGGLGDMITARNSSSGKRFRATVVALKQVVIVVPERP